MAKGEIIKLDLTINAARDIITRTAHVSSHIFFTYHALEQMKGRRITKKQVIACLKGGGITEGPILGRKDNWECTIEGYCAGQGLAAVVAIKFMEDSSNHIIVITSYKI